MTAGVPNVLRTQGEYDITMVVDPGNANRIVIAGSYIAATNPDGKPTRATTARSVGGGRRQRGQADVRPPRTPDVIGVGVHADVHDLRFSKAGARLWISCDGGVFRSEKPTQQVGFVACNDGLSIAEANFVASHPTCEGHIVSAFRTTASSSETRTASGESSR